MAILFLLLLFFSTLTKLSFIWILRLSVAPPDSFSSYSSSPASFPTPHSVDLWSRILETQNYDYDYFGVEKGADEDALPVPEGLVDRSSPKIADESLREELDVDFEGGVGRDGRIGSRLKRQINLAPVHDFAQAQK